MAGAALNVAAGSAAVDGEVVVRAAAQRGGGRTDRPTGSAGAPKGLGGRQIEGRTGGAREMLIAGRRKVHEIWISSELEGLMAGVDDIVTIAKAQRCSRGLYRKESTRAGGAERSPAGGVGDGAPSFPRLTSDPLLHGDGTAPPFLVAVDGVTDPGNLGAIIRSCDGAGVSGVLLPRHRAVHVTPTVAKAAAGAVEFVPITLVPGLPAVLKTMKEHGIWVVGLDDSAERDLFEPRRSCRRGPSVSCSAPRVLDFRGLPVTAVTLWCRFRCSAASVR